MKPHEVPYPALNSSQRVWVGSVDGSSSGFVPRSITAKDLESGKSRERAS